jgi:RNAse (barnase) inhibitor barstar
MKTIHDFHELFENNIEPDIYLLDDKVNIQLINHLTSKNSLCLFYMDGRSISDEQTFFKKISSVMRFPDYFGHNWNAVEECIRDLSWSQASEYIIIYENFEVLAQKDPKAFDIAKSIFQEARDYWREQNIKMHILFIPSNGD